MFDPIAIKSQFPIFKKKTPNGVDLIYLDNAATTQKPQQVIDAITDYYSGYNANVGRGTYWPATKATGAFEATRTKVKDFINANSLKEVIFTSGTTDGINKVVNAYLMPQLKPGDEVIVTEMEHHGNFVPWQQACIKQGASLKMIPLTETGDLDYGAYDDLLNENTQLVAISAISNALGVKNNLEYLTNKAHAVGAKVMVDAAQLVTHEKIDVQAIGCDFLCFSAHKLFGPTGVGVLFGKEELLSEMPPLSFGGGMVKRVTLEGTSFADLPAKHEAGTSNISGVIGLGAAIDFVNSIGIEAIHTHTRALTDYAIEKFSHIEEITIFGNPKDRTSLVSLAVEKAHPHDVSAFLGERGIAIRAGHHCAQPLMDYLQVSGTCRISFGIYNTKEDVDRVVEALIEVRDFFA